MRVSAEKINSFIIKHPVFIILLILILTGAAASNLAKVKIDNSVDVFFDKQSKAYLGFEGWKEQFGSDQVVIVAFRDTDIFTRQNLTLISRLTQKFESLQYVDNVISLTNVNDIIGYESDFIVERLVEELPSGPEQLRELKKQALGNPLYVKNVISGDGKTTAIAVELEHRPASDDIYKKEAIENISGILEEEFPQDKKFYMSGFTAIEHFYTAYMQDDLKTFMPFMFIIIIGILYMSFRRTKIVVLPLITIIVSLIFALSLLYLLGFSINNVTTIIPPILMAIAIADSIHLVGESIQKRRRARENGLSKGNILSGTMRHLFFPCFLTTLTTAVGFLSLTVSRIPPVKELGLVVGIGVFFALIVTFTLLPALIQKLRVLDDTNSRGFILRKSRLAAGGQKQADERGLIKREVGFFGKGFDGFLRAVGRFNERRAAVIVIFTAGLVCAALWGAGRIETETSVIEYFKKGSPIYEATAFIEENLSGVHFLNVSLKAKERDYFKTPGALRDIEKLQYFLAGIPEVDKTTAVVDYIKEINKSFHNEDDKFYKIPSSRKLVAQYLLLYGASDLDDFVDSAWAWTTVRVRLKEHSTIRLKEIIKKIEGYLNMNFPKALKAEVLGQTVLEVETNNAVTAGQIQSLALAMIVIFGMMFVVFRSIPVGLVSIIPNILPLLLNFGIMGLAGIRLDSATSMISAVGIGIIVDDTIHFLHTFGESLKATNDYTAAMHKTLLSKGRPIILTSVVLCFGFGVVGLSQFVPTSYFGLLSSLLMFNALLADLVVLPCVLLIFKPKFNLQRVGSNKR